MARWIVILSTLFVLSPRAFGKIEGWNCQAALDQLTELDPAADPFLRPVLTAPDDLVARAKYGDWLAERGSPLGDVLLANIQLHAIRLNRDGQSKKAKAIWRDFGKSSEAEEVVEARRDEILGAWLENLSDKGGESLVLEKLAAAFPDVDPRSVQFIPIEGSSKPFDLALSPNRPVSVEVPQSYDMQATPVAQWLAAILGQSSEVSAGHQTVLGVSHDLNRPWNRAEDFPYEDLPFKRARLQLEALDGHFRYLIPTRPEWYWAASAGNQYDPMVNEFRAFLPDVAQGAPNPWGLYDARGGVRERAVWGPMGGSFLDREASPLDWESGPRLTEDLGLRLLRVPKPRLLD